MTKPDLFIIGATNNREVVRLCPDGTWRIVPDITEKEIRTAFHPLVQTAAGLFKRVSELEKKYEPNPELKVETENPDEMEGVY